MIVLERLVARLDCLSPDKRLKLVSPVTYEC